MKTIIKKLLFFSLILLFQFQTVPAQAAWRYAGESVSTQTQMKQSTQKMKHKKKPHKKPLDWRNVGLWIVLAGVIMFIVGLIVKIPALWIVGLCIALIPALFYLVLFLILIIAFATGSGYSC